MSEAKHATADDLLEEARSLATAPAAALEPTLQSLRLRYREAPSLFTPEKLKLLRDAATRAAQSRVDCGDRALAVLRDVFGYMEMIDTVLAQQSR
jgi:hypothetical protein